MNNKYAYIQYTEIPGVRAHSILVCQTCFAASKLNQVVHLIIPNEINQEYQGKQSIWNYYNIPNKQFKVIKINTKHNLVKKILSKSSYIYHFINVLLFALKSWLVSRKIKLDIIQTSDPEVVLVFNIFSFIYKPKIIYDIHLDPPKWLISFLLKKTDLIVCNSKYYKQLVLKKGVNKNRIIKLPNGYNPEDYKKDSANKLKRKLKINPKDFVIGYIGRLETIDKEKGIKTLLKVGKEINLENLKILLVGGPNKLVNKYKKITKGLNLDEKKVIITGQVKPGKVSEYIKVIDLAWLVYPDIPHYRYKMSPMKVIEYMAAVKPIIASDFPSIKELLNQKSAYLVNPENTDQIIKTIRQIFKNPKLAIQKAQKANQFIKNLSWLDRQRRVLEQL